MNGFRAVVLLMLGLIALLQVRIWSAQSGVPALQHLNRQVATLEASVMAQQRENERLRDRVRAVRQDPQALEALARRDLGMLMPDERFVRLIVLPPPGQAAAVSRRAAPSGP